MRSRHGLENRVRRGWLFAVAILFVLTGCAKQGADVNGQRVHSLYNVIFMLALPVFVVVEALLLWYVIRYRKRDSAAPPQSFGTRRALIAFFLIPTVIVAVDYAYGERTLAQVEKRPMMSWLELDKAHFAGVFKGAPVRDELNEPAIREQYVVEYYSR